MKKLILIFALLLSTGCAFKDLESCGLEGAGAGCTPVNTNLSNAIAKSENRDNAVSASNLMDYSLIDKGVLVDELRRVSPQYNSNGDAASPEPLRTTKVLIRVYPYSDGDRYYDVRDIYILVQKSGWNRGSYVQTDAGIVPLVKIVPKLAKKLIVTASDELHVRTGGSINFPAITTVKKDDILTHLSYHDGWYEVEFTKRKKDSEIIRGYVHGGYVNERF